MMKLPRRQFLHLAAGAAALPTLPSAALSQDWPMRSVTMIVPYPAGAGVDLMGRILASRMSELLGRPIVIENVGGAGGMAGVARTARAAPDGYQFVLGDTSALAASQTLYRSRPYNSTTDFSPVTLIATTPQVLIARNDLPANNMEEFVAFAKANGTKMQYGSAGLGSPGHLACLMFNSTAGVDVTHIPYRGAAPALQDLIAGRIDYQCTVGPSAIPQIEGKSVKGIATLSRGRFAGLPGLASAHEQGLAEFDAATWFAFFLPKGTAPAIVQKLNDASVAAMTTPAVQDRLKEIGMTLVEQNRRSPEYLQKFVLDEIEKWAAPIKASGLVLD
jgi:tripartite-type tricarboxylate transporter receptor subunit TctC